MNSFDCSAMTFLAAVGQTNAHQVAFLLHTLLSGTPGIRPGLITESGVWLGDRELPAPPPYCPRLHYLLPILAAGGCTHVVLCPTREELARGDYAHLHLSVTIPVGPVDAWQDLSPLLGQSDLCVFDLDESGWEDYVNIIPGHSFTYSENKACADLTARNLRLFPGHTEFEAVATGQIQRIHLPLCGGFTVYHALGALSCGLCLGLSLRSMARIMPAARGPAGCMEVLSIPAAYTVLLDRAEDLPSLERTLTAARSFTARQLVCLLEDRVSKPMEDLANHLADRVVSFRAARADRLRAIVRGLDRAAPGDVLVLTGTDGGPQERAFIRACAHRCALHHRRRN